MLAAEASDREKVIQEHEVLRRAANSKWQEAKAEETAALKELHQAFTHLYPSNPN